MLVLLRDQQCFHICLDQTLSHLHVSLFQNPIILLYNMERVGLHFKDYILNFVISQLWN